MIYIICKMSLLLKNYPNYLKDNIFESFIKSIINIFFFLYFFSQYIKMKNLRPEKDKIIKNIRNLFRLEKETKRIKDVILIDIKNLFDEYYKPVRANNF